MKRRKEQKKLFYSHVNYSVTKMESVKIVSRTEFYSHVNFSVTKIVYCLPHNLAWFYSHVNFSVTKIGVNGRVKRFCFTVT